MKENKILAIFTDTVTDKAIADIEKKHTDLVHDFNNEAEFKVARKVNTEMNKLLIEIDKVGIAASKEVTARRNNLKERVESAYSGTVTPFKIEDQRRKDEVKRIEKAKQNRIFEQKTKLGMIKGASARAIHMKIDDIEEILQEVMNIDLSFFDKEMLQEAKAAKEISLSQLKDAFKFVEHKEEMRKSKENQEAVIADKNDEIEMLKKKLSSIQPEKNEVDVKFIELSLSVDVEKSNMTSISYNNLSSIFNESDIDKLFQDEQGCDYKIEFTAKRKEILNKC